VNIALVYVGARAPKYFWKNLSYITKTFPDHQVVFITDQSSDIKKSKKLGFNAWQSTSVHDSWAKIRQHMDHPLDFRQGFWFLTIARLVALAEFMNENPDVPLIHVEGDVWLSPQFPLIEFKKVIKNFAFPLESPNVGVASTLFIRNAAAAKDLLSFAEKYLSENPSGTDMKILGQLALSHPEQCLILPTSTPWTELKNNQQREMDRRFFENIDIFRGLFDGVQWGAYMLGEDPRNHRGIRYVFNRAIPREVRPWEYSLSLTSSGLPAVTVDSQVIPLFSLHVHTKNPKLFSDKRMSNAWRRRLIQEKNGLRKEIVVKVLLIQIFKALVRRGNKIFIFMSNN